MTSQTFNRNTQIPSHKNVLLWNVDDVVNWLGRSCSVDIQSRYAQRIQYHDINGRALMRMNDEKLQIIGIENSSHRYEILKEIYKQQLRCQEKHFKELNQHLSGRIENHSVSQSLFGSRQNF